MPHQRLSFLPEVPAGSEVGVGVGGGVNEIVVATGGVEDGNEIVVPTGGLEDGFSDGIFESAGRDVGEPMGTETVKGALAGAKSEPAKSEPGTSSPSGLGFLSSRPFPVGDVEGEGALPMDGSFSEFPCTLKTV